MYGESVRSPRGFRKSDRASAPKGTPSADMRLALMIDHRRSWIRALHRRKYQHFPFLIRRWARFPS